MRAATRALAPLAAAASVQAFPQQTAPPNATRPAATPGATPAPACEADCSVNVPYFYQYSWTPNVITQNITYATVITIINTRYNTTRYSTKTVDLPDGYTLPPTNEAGTIVCPVTLYDNTTSLLTYPNVFGDYESTYSWGGKIATTKATEPSSTFCSDSPGETVTLRSHPDLNEWWSTYGTQFDKPAPTTTLDAAHADPRGLNWACVKESAAFPTRAFLSTFFADEAALFPCTSSMVGPVGAEATAAFLTANSISYEGDDDGPTTSSPNGEATTIPATAHIETSVPVEVPTPTGGDVTSTAHIETSAVIEPPTPTSLGDGPTSTAHIETSAVLEPPPPTVTSSAASAHTEISTTLAVPTQHIETSVTLQPPSSTSAPTEVGTVVEPPDVTSLPGFAHTEQSADPLPPSVTSRSSFAYTAHTELPQSLDEPTPTQVTVAPPAEVGSVVQPAPITTANGGGVGGVIGSIIESYFSNGGTPPTNVPGQPQQGAQNNPPAGTQAPPVTYIPVGSTSVAVAPTFIPTVIAGISTSVPAVVVGSSTVLPGQTVVFDNTPISVPTVNAQAPSNGQAPPNGQENNHLQGQPQAPAVIIGGSSTVILPTVATAPQPTLPALTIGGETVQPSGTAYIISGQTMSPGSPITLGSGSSTTIIALTTNAAGSSIVVVGSSTIPYTAAPTNAAAPALTVADQTIHPSGSAYILSGQTLLPNGSPITLTGPNGAPTTLALTTDSAGNTVLASNGVTQTLAGVSAQTTPGPLVLYGTTIQPTGGTAYVWNGQTLSLGGSITIGGSTTLALTTNAQGQTVVVQQIGGASATTTTASAVDGLGGFINSGLGGTAAPTSASASVSSTGAAMAVGGRGLASGMLGAVVGVLVAVV